MFELSSAAKEFIEKNSDKKIVFTNGCFDIVHVGHIAYLNEARAQGDLLFMGLNSDNSIKRLKGDDRPINCEADRKFFMENLKPIDFVEIFEEDTPMDLISAVLPDVLVKGGDWTPAQIVGSDVVLANGGEVKSLLFKHGYSTTNMIQKLQGKQ
ncbi:MAG: D-glycero-beta-D-manno-heptose 1-phosphate adenylyltransferase [Bacteriovoracaceae bacterium]|nr:D-glycero-beta-D-manno-heptose 1-phosphate adenylyltransferase [Bacteriovoracaceae bacterium]